MLTIVYTRPAAPPGDPGGVSVMRPAPWRRRVAAINRAGVRTDMNGDMAERVIRALRGLDPDAAVPVTQEGFARFVAEWEPEWAETEAEFCDRMAARYVPAGITYTLVDDAAIPTDRTFRNAWVQNGGGAPAIDMPAARAMHMARIRAARNAKLATLDPLWQRAMGRGDTATAAAVEAQRETLRNLPAVVDLNSAATVEDLKAIWPAELNGR